MRNLFYSLAILFALISPLFAILLQTKYTINLDESLSFHVAGKQIVGNWIVGGEATVLASDIIRLTDLKPHQEGWVYSQQAISHTRWTTELYYRISGGLAGGEGMVFWVLDNSETQPPSVIEKSNWRGLAVVLDTNAKGGESELSVVYNDGNSFVSPLADEQKVVLGTCRYVPRNAEQSIIRVTNEGDEISVEILVNDGEDPMWMDCVAAPFVLTTGNYKFAVTASTGEAADLHFVVRTDVYALVPKGTEKRSPAPAQPPKVTKTEPSKEEQRNSADTMKSILDTHRDIKKKFNSMQVEMQEITTKINANSNTMNSIISKFEGLVGSSHSAEARVAFKGDVVSPETGFSPEDERKMRNALSELRHLALEKLESIVDKVLKNMERISDQFDTDDWEYRKASSSHKNTKMWQTEQLKNVPVMYESHYSWMYYVFIFGFEAAWIFAVFFWRKFRVNTAKKSQ